MERNSTVGSSSGSLARATPPGILSNGADAPVRESEIAREFNRLERLIAESSMFLSRFEDKINPILAPQSPEKEPGSPTVATSSGIGQFVSQLSEKVAAFNRRMVSINERVQL